jgi:protocatechuate 3,4-dioxygenase beta subunit
MKTAMFLAAVMILGMTIRANETPNLEGKVLGIDGAPIEGATVFIYTAGPKVGTGSICPSCYPDCRKKARTDAQGRFKIADLDPKLLFRLLVVSGGFQPKFVSKVDPEQGSQEITLERRVADPSRSTLRGMVLGPEGQPVFGAVFNVSGIEKGLGTRWGAV